MTMLMIETRTHRFDTDTVKYDYWEIPAGSIDYFIDEVSAFDRIHECSTEVSTYDLEEV